MRATWYTLEDGSAVDPSEVTRDDHGALVHKNGKVAVGDHGNYRTRGVDVGEDGKLVDSGATVPKKTGEMKPEPTPAPAKKPGYMTRKAK